jgi:microsomal dipeptidase-like Zn-dependent dipeptidase
MLTTSKLDLFVGHCLISFKKLPELTQITSKLPKRGSKDRDYIKIVKKNYVKIPEMA